MSRDNEQDKKTTLPPFGLAEDILGEDADGCKAPEDTETGDAPAEGAVGEDEGESRVRIISFFLAGQEYGVEISRVREIVRVSEITFVPHVAEYISGVINLRGNVLPVIDLKKKMGLGETEDGIKPHNRIMVVDYEDEVLGLLVDLVASITVISSGLVDTSSRGETEESGHTETIARVDDKTLILLDLDRALSREEQKNPQ